VKVRLLKVVVQPVFVLDDGETLVEVEHPATVIPAAEWPTYSSERFPREVGEWQRKLDNGAATALGDGVASETAEPDSDVAGGRVADAAAANGAPTRA
jgi:hypothetical protein